MKSLAAIAAIFSALLILSCGIWTGAIWQHDQDQQVFDFDVRVIRGYQQQVSNIPPCTPPEMEN